MLSILNQPDHILKGLMLSKPEGIFEKKRNGSILAINSRLGACTIFDGPFATSYRRLNKPISYMDFISNSEGIPPAMYVAFMEKAFSKGLLALSGRVIDETEIQQGNREFSRVIILRFGENPDALRHFETVIGNSAWGPDEKQIIIRLEGKVWPHYGELADFIKRIKKNHDDEDKLTSFILEADNLEQAEMLLKMPRDHSLSVSFTIKIPGENEEIVDFAAKLTELGIPAPVTGIFTDPLQIGPTVEKLVERNILNIGVRMDPSVYLKETSVTAHLKAMEAFAQQTLETVDLQYSALFRSVKKLFLIDIQRFIKNLLRPNIIHPCSRRPCGMGSQVLLHSDDGSLMACRSAGPISEEKLLIGRQSDNNQSENPMKFWEPRAVAGPRCARCPWESFCGGGCPVLKLEKFGSLDREDPRCRYFQIIFEELIWKIHKNPGIAAKIGGLF